MNIFKMSAYLFLGLFGTFGLASESKSLSTLLTPIEEKLLEDSIEKFYQGARPEVMNQAIPKVIVSTGQFKTHPSILDNISMRKYNLKESAGKKLDPSYLESRKQWLQRRFKSNHEMRGWSHFEEDDKVEDLAKTWMSRDELSFALDELPIKGQISGEYWSGDYWRMNWGLTSYRYSSGKQYKKYKEAVNSYFQPQEWLQLTERTSANDLAKDIVTWSPAEKYDLLVGDIKFTLTNEQKGEGADVVNSHGAVEDWFGICDGWSAASVFVPTPKNPVKSVGTGGVEVTWLPDDIRAMATLAWTNGNYESNFIGRRCESKDPKLYPNGRVSEQDCFDTNPATFHLALGNLLGKSGVPMIMDSSFDSEVWNQPIVSYEIKYFNPLDRGRLSKDWKSVMVAYDDKFKENDRFQSPLTRGLRKHGKYSDKEVKAIVGVQATIVYLAEYELDFEKQPQENVTQRVTYVYDLELYEKDGKLVPLGGEWHNNTHPDFLWLPEKGSISKGKWDSDIPKINLSAMPEDSLTEVAKKASAKAYPLCSVVEALVEASSGTSSYRCSQRRN